MVAVAGGVAAAGVVVDVFGGGLTVATVIRDSRVVPMLLLLELGTLLGDLRWLRRRQLRRPTLRPRRPPPSAPSSFYDDNSDDQARTSSGPSLSISVTGHVSVAQPSSLADPLGRFRSFFPDPSAAIGFFSSRRRTPLCPSMREAALACSLPLEDPNRNKSIQYHGGVGEWMSRMSSSLVKRKLPAALHCA
ncbi:hypothetical protein E2562_019929 [Oryza meyeriana var. granulata]|uniref:Uncharacterized protein n=1 Tax=Oryza meyeriana var. granulata TaxID=110450 RepID=A0A6G1EXE9_9ORYZ|nr:hypothetical protein E2562_019929 [Oryza meyeriana var. granulata]